MSCIRALCACLVLLIALSACTATLGRGPRASFDGGTGFDSTVPPRDGQATDIPFSAIDAHLPDFGQDEGLDIGQGTPDGIAPTANAGADVSIAWPLDRVIVAGSVSDTRGPVSTVWTWIDGSSVAVLRNETLAAPIATSLRVGSYVFRLTVTDNEGLPATDEVAVSVTPAAHAQANIAEFVEAQTSPVVRTMRNIKPLSVGAFVSTAMNTRLAEKYRCALHNGDMSAYHANIATAYSGRMQQFVDLSAGEPATYATLFDIDAMRPTDHMLETD